MRIARRRVSRGDAPLEHGAVRLAGGAVAASRRAWRRGRPCSPARGPSVASSDGGPTPSSTTHRWTSRPTTTSTSTRLAWAWRETLLSASRSVANSSVAKRRSTPASTGPSSITRGSNPRDSAASRTRSEDLGAQSVAAGAAVLEAEDRRADLLDRQVEIVDGLADPVDRRRRGHRRRRGSCSAAASRWRRGVGSRCRGGRGRSALDPRRGRARAPGCSVGRSRWRRRPRWPGRRPAPRRRR